ncbi:ABC transporter ATP-binding protein [Desulfosoma sp.]
MGSEPGGPILEAPVLQCIDLRLTLPDGRPLLQGLCLDILPGQYLQIVGPSGCGKTTLLRMLAAFERPEAGTILWNGTPLEDVPGPVLRSSVIYVAQTPGMVAGTVHTNLLVPFGFRSHRNRPQPSPQEIRHLLDHMGMEDVALDRAVQDLSAGQRHRLAVLRALLLHPQVLLLDEPMSALDRESQASVESVLEAVRVREATSIVLVSHQEPVRKRPDAVLRMHLGRLVPEGGHENGTGSS